MIPPALSRRTLLKRSALAFPALAGLRASVRAQAAREGRLGVASAKNGGTRVDVKV